MVLPETRELPFSVYVAISLLTIIPLTWVQVDGLDYPTNRALYWGIFGGWVGFQVNFAARWLEAWRTKE